MLCAAIASAAWAQAGAGDSIVVRVQRLAGDGNAAAGRALVDSVLGAATAGSPAYVNALFARASIAESADAARKDYLRIALDYSMSPRAEDALLRLAQLEIARGDRAAAKQYLERLALEHPNGVSRAQGAYWLGRVLLDDGAVVGGVRVARRSEGARRGGGRGACEPDQLLLEAMRGGSARRRFRARGFGRQGDESRTCGFSRARGLDRRRRGSGGESLCGRREEKSESRAQEGDAEKSKHRSRRHLKQKAADGRRRSRRTTRRKKRHASRRN